MKLSRALNEKMMDLRLRDKLLTEGKITQKQLDDYLSALPDDAENCSFIEDGPSEKEISNDL